MTEQNDIDVSNHRAAVWADLQLAFHRDEIIEGRITRCIRRGYLVDFDGVTGFLPGRYIDVLPVADPAPFLDRRSQFKILRCDQLHNRLVVSRRATLPDLKLNAPKLDELFHAGQMLSGTVRHNLAYGAFIDLGHDILGFLPLFSGAQAPVNGSTIQVQVVRINTDTQRVFLRTC